MNTLMHTDLQLEGLESKYVGKVRDVYRLKNKFDARQGAMFN